MERQKEKKSVIWFTAQLPTIESATPGHRCEPPMWVVETQVFGPASHALPGVLLRNWIGSGG